MTNTPITIVPYRIEFRRGRKQYTVDLNSTLGKEAAIRRARLALAFNLNVPMDKLVLISCTAHPEA